MVYGDFRLFLKKLMSCIAEFNAIYSINISDTVYIQDLTRVVISYEIYETSLRRGS